MFSTPLNIQGVFICPGSFRHPTHLSSPLLTLVKPDCILILSHYHVTVHVNSYIGQWTATPGSAFHLTTGGTIWTRVFSTWANYIFHLLPGRDLSNPGNFIETMFAGSLRYVAGIPVRTTVNLVTAADSLKTIKYCLKKLMRKPNFFRWSYCIDNQTR